MNVEGQQQERPGSGNSDMTRMTGGQTAALTQISMGNRSTNTAMMAKAQEIDQAMRQLNDPRSKLASFIKYDTTLGREQNIEFSKESSLANKDRMFVKGGVKLTHFHPEKKPSMGQTTTIDETKTESDDESPLTQKV